MLKKSLLSLIAISSLTSSLYAIPYTSVLPLYKVDKRVTIKETKIEENHAYQNCNFKLEQEKTKCTENPIVINDYIGGKSEDALSDNYNPDTNAVYLDKEIDKCFKLVPQKTCTTEKAKDFVTSTRMYKNVAYYKGDAYSTYTKKPKAWIKEKPPYIKVYGLKYSEERRKLIDNF